MGRSSDPLEFPREVAGGEVSALLHLQRGLDLRADLLRDRAASVEAACGRWVHGRGDLALQQDRLTRRLEVGVWNRHRALQHLGVGVKRLVADGVARTYLDDLAQV